MAKKDKLGGFVYSTNPDFEIRNTTFGGQTTLPNAEQNLTVQKSSKGRGGKTVTLVTGFIGKEEDLEKLAKLLKNKCGVGGNAKEGEVLIQGDIKEKVADILRKEGYKVKISGG